MKTDTLLQNRIWTLSAWLLSVAVCGFCSCRGVPGGKTAAINKPAAAVAGKAHNTTAPSPAPVSTPAPVVHAEPAVVQPAASSSQQQAAVARVSHHGQEECEDQHIAAPPRYPALPPQAFHGYQPSPTPWRPPGIAGTWPRDEYIHDGGDRNRGVHIGRDWTVRGLDQEDTIAHYDTIDGRTRVQPSNRVPIYAPRFAAVRKISGVVLYHQNDQLRGFAKPTHLARADETRIPSTVLQPRQPLGKVGMRAPNIFHERLPGAGLDNAQASSHYDGQFKLHEDFQIIRKGIYDSAEKLRLAGGIEAARAWQHDAGVEAIAEAKRGAGVKNNSRPQQTILNERPPGTPELRVVKVASKKHAKPGEIIDFTIRFDNLGDQTIGNVTVIDNLTPRLEYVEGSASCTLKADFFSQVNEGESLVLRWEIVDPLPATKGGIIRFKCRVR